MHPIARFCRRIWPPLPVWRRLDLSVATVVVYTLLVDIVVEHFDIGKPKWIGDFNIVNAVLLGVLLGFRNKEAYDRWWEARKLWGQLINETRNFALKARAYLNVNSAEGARTAGLLYGFAIALKRHLWARSHGSPAPSPGPSNVAAECFAVLRDWRKNGTITEVELLFFDTHAKALMDVCGACERIQSSPVPLSYRSLLRHGTIIYLLTAPWFMADEFGHWGIAIVGLIAYFLLGTELTAESIEDPFGIDGDDLELARFCETIRTSVDEILGTTTAKAELF